MAKKYRLKVIYKGSAGSFEAPFYNNEPLEVFCYLPESGFVARPFDPVNFTSNFSGAHEGFMMSGYFEDSEGSTLVRETVQVLYLVLEAVGLIGRIIEVVKFWFVDPDEAKAKQAIIKNYKGLIHELDDIV